MEALSFGALEKNGGPREVASDKRENVFSKEKLLTYAGRTAASILCGPLEPDLHEAPRVPQTLARRPRRRPSGCYYLKPWNMEGSSGGRRGRVVLEHGPNFW